MITACNVTAARCHVIAGVNRLMANATKWVSPHIAASYN